MTKAQRFSLVVFVGLMLACVAAVIVYDVWAATSGQASTISWAMALWAASSPIVPFAWGFVVGAVIFGLAAHFWTSMISPADFAEMARLRAEVAQLEAENDRLRDRVVTMMVDADGGRPSSLS
jgi:uncharacterized membrane protein (DUF106 family)